MAEDRTTHQWVRVYCKETCESYRLAPSQEYMDRWAKQLETGQVKEGAPVKILDFVADTLADVEDLRRQYAGPEVN
jgi:hypothetical protein